MTAPPSPNAPRYFSRDKLNPAASPNHQRACLCTRPVGLAASLISFELIIGSSYDCFHIGRLTIKRRLDMIAFVLCYGRFNLGWLNIDVYLSGSAGIGVALV